LLDLLAVLVGARQEERVVALEAVEARDDVHQQGRVRVTQMRLGVDVEDRRRRVVRVSVLELRLGRRLRPGLRFLAPIDGRTGLYGLLRLIEHDAVPGRAIAHRLAPPGAVYSSDAGWSLGKRQGRRLYARRPGGC